MFDHLEEIKRVADALTIPVANGEQDHSLYGFRWLIKGKIKVPTGPGFGVDIDPEWMAKHQAVTL